MAKIQLKPAPAKNLLEEVIGFTEESVSADCCGTLKGCNGATSAGHRHELVYKWIHMTRWADAKR